KFVNGPIDASWGGAWESVPAACAVGEFADRSVSVGYEDMVLPPVLFGTCEVHPFMINNFDAESDATDEGTNAWWTEFDESDNASNFSTLTQIPTDQVPHPADIVDWGSPVMSYQYSVVHDQGWGGYTGAYHKFDQAVDLSNFSHISFKFYNYVQASVLENMSLRLNLWDVSNVTTWSSKDDVEYWYSFFNAPGPLDFPVSSDTGWVEFKVPLIGAGSAVTDHSNGFVRTGWNGIAGNDTFDKDKIGGITIEVVLQGSAVADDQIYGQFLIDDLRAIYSTDVAGCMDPNACNYNPDATVEDGSCYECSQVTFSVDMQLEDTHVEGVWVAGGGFGQVGFPLSDDDNDDVWVADTALEIGATYLYKFRNHPPDGTWNNFEEAGGLANCGTGEYTDRYFTVPAADTALGTVCYASCLTCEELNFVDVMFAVNMRDEDTDPAGVWLAGGNFGGNPGHLMLDTDEDDIWTITLPATPNSDITYKFVNGPIDASWQGGWEEVPLECSVGDFADRQFSVGGEDAMADTVCFSSCENCIEDHPVDVTFNLDMNGVAGFDGSEAPYVFGSFNNWDNISTQTMLADSDGDNIYTGTVPDLMYEDSITLLFGFGSNFETVPDTCGILDASLGMNVRLLPIYLAGSDSVLILDAIHYGSCPADTLLTNDENVAMPIPTEFSYKTYPNPFNPYINIYYELPHRENVTVTITNLLGQEVKTLVNSMQNPGRYFYRWDGKDSFGKTLQSGIYFAVINRESGIDISKITFLK
ncbi:MAG: hypothetical protein CMG74_09970, partial [Candidatus Marinimicrobia bacterium]|nr:hypothetical protein [Candidatus Neomarinimicrobiota bacterium]